MGEESSSSGHQGVCVLTKEREELFRPKENIGIEEEPEIN